MKRPVGLFLFTTIVLLKPVKNIYFCVDVVLPYVVMSMCMR